MFYITENNKIILTRGDTATMEVKAYDLDGKEYVIKPTDVITMKVRKTINTQVLINKVADSNHIITLLPEDTSVLESGLYVYDVQITTQENNVYTIIPSNFFDMREEISNG